MWLTLASLAAPIIGSIISGKQQKKAIKQAQEMAPPTLSSAEAEKQAMNLLNPLYDTQREENIKAVDRHNLQRGFYGQLPGDVLRRSTADQTERDRAGQIASLTQQMVGQSQQQALQQQQMAMQYALGLGQQRQSNFGSLLNTGINTMFGYHDRTGQFPWEKGLASQIGLEGGMGKLNNKQLLDLASSTNWGTQATPETLGGFSFGQPSQQYKLNYTNPWK